MAETFAGMLWVALGASIGAPLRFFLSGLVGRSIGETFPWGTFAINVSGSFVIGVFAAFAAAHTLASTSAPWLFVVTGVLGSYTTVSSFALQTINLARDGERHQALAYAALSLVLCLISTALGFALGQAMNG